MPSADWLKPGATTASYELAAISRAVEPSSSRLTADDAAERRDRVGLERVPVGLDELVVRGQTDRVGVLDDDDRGRRVVAGDPVRGVEVEQVVERGHRALQAGRVGERAAAVRRLAVERRALVRVLAVAEVADLLEDEGQPAREGVARDLVEVGGDLRVIGRDHAERLGREPGPRLRADPAELAQLVDDARVVARVGGGGDTGRVARGGAEERRSADVDHLDRLVDPDQGGADGRRERLDVDDDEVDEPDALGLELGELGRDVAAREDAGVDRVVEGLDLATDARPALGQLGDGRDLDALGSEVLTGAVGGVDLHVVLEQCPSERSDAIPVRD